ncbi:glycine betaine ABC transporter substrate-binding protein [Peribacillus sp. NPDC097895]|uniref:ABC transporter substrate-binding protein n=1 Tax=Peribacillus sp. NPDC097895 TaxID=3390619 RepID=UPI003D091CFA
MSSFFKVCRVFVMFICCLFLLSCNDSHSIDSTKKENQLKPEEASEKPVIQIGSKSLTEQYLLMKMTALLLKYEGFRVKEIRFLDSPSIRQALEQGYIDMYWEYTNTARMYYHKKSPVYNGDQLYNLVKEEDAMSGITWLNRSDFNSSWRLIVTRSFVEKHHIHTISDLMKYIQREEKKIKIATNEEFLIREDGFKRLNEAYHIDMGKENVIALDSKILPLAVKEGRVDVAVGMGSDSHIEEYGLVVLKEDKVVFPPYHAAPVMLTKTMKEYPIVSEKLNGLSAELTNEKIHQLVYKVDILHQDVSKVAYDFLVANELIQK